ncbi:hypothetical protein [Halobaculum rarum]|uniref:hypothetical protein n=1 Tax=Halobaculum rarum TaxID=3075122 RepID=UPI0032AFE581
MARDTIVSWKTFALFVLFPPLAIIAIVFFPLTLYVLFWLYYRGKNEVRMERTIPESGEPVFDN